MNLKNKQNHNLLIIKEVESDIKVLKNINFIHIIHILDI